jgi:saccharopine dehydrogenase-like NADP-dependent oxidoreductase
LSSIRRKLRHSAQQCRIASANRKFIPSPATFILKATRSFESANRLEGEAMRDILVIGGGNIGEMITDLLGRSGDYAVTVADRSLAALDRPRVGGVRVTQLDVADGAALARALQGRFAVISALPYRLTEAVARAAHAAGIHYLDLTEDIAATRAVTELAATAKGAFVPQCGLAPGFISIVANDLVREFDEVDMLRLRVGALPLYPSNSLTYNLTWSTDGVINEYCEPCDAIVDGRQVLVPALDQVERFALDGVHYESFNTSGGLGSLCQSLAGKVRNLSYQTIRYPGHRDIMKTLLRDLRLSERRDLLREVLENAVPTTDQDVVIIFVTAIGRRGGKLTEHSHANKIYARQDGKRTWAAIQVTTASSVCAVLDLLSHGRIASRGLVRQEDIPLPLFLDNRFGKAYMPAPGYSLAA